MDNVIVTQVVPHPFESKLPIVREYREDLHAMDDSIAPTFGGLEGYIAARIFLKAIKNFSAPLTKESFLHSAMGMEMQDFRVARPP